MHPSWCGWPALPGWIPARPCTRLHAGSAAVASFRHVYRTIRRLLESGIERPLGFKILRRRRPTGPATAMPTTRSSVTTTIVRRSGCPVLPAWPIWVLSASSCISGTPIIRSKAWWKRSILSALPVTWMVGRARKRLGLDGGPQIVITNLPSWTSIRSVSKCACSRCIPMSPLKRSRGRRGFELLMPNGSVPRPCHQQRRRYD